MAQFPGLVPIGGRDIGLHSFSLAANLAPKGTYHDMNSSSSNGWKDAAKVIGILYLIGVLWMHVPSVFRSLVGGTRRIEIEQNTTGFYLVERSWWFGDTRRFRFVLASD